MHSESFNQSTWSVSKSRHFQFSVSLKQIYTFCLWLWTGRYHTLDIKNTVRHCNLKKKKVNTSTEQEYHRLIFRLLELQSTEIMSGLTLVRTNETEKYIITFFSDIPTWIYLRGKNFHFLRKTTTEQLVELRCKERRLCFLPRGSWQAILQKKMMRPHSKTTASKALQTTKACNWSSGWERTTEDRKKAVL